MFVFIRDNIVIVTLSGFSIAAVSDVVIIMTCIVCSLIIHEQILLFVSSATHNTFMNCALNMKIPWQILN